MESAEPKKTTLFWTMQHNVPFVVSEGKNGYEITGGSLAKPAQFYVTFDSLHRINNRNYIVALVNLNDSMHSMMIYKVIDNLQIFKTILPENND